MKTTSVSDALALMAFIPLAKTFLPYNQNNCLQSFAMLLKYFQIQFNPPKKQQVRLGFEATVVITGPFGCLTHNNSSGEGWYQSKLNYKINLLDKGTLTRLLKKNPNDENIIHYHLFHQPTKSSLKYQGQLYIYQLVCALKR